MPFQLSRKLKIKLKGLIFKYLNDTVFFLIFVAVIVRTASGAVSVILGKSQSGISIMDCRDTRKI